MSAIEGLWKRPVTITENNFVYKSLSNWACNIAVGCNHKCRFCYVPDASTIKLSEPLKEFGVTDPDAQWGDYVLLRPWDEKAFRASLKRAVATDPATLKPDGNRAIMFCSTTDPYQILSNKVLNQARRDIVREALKIIRDESDLRVRILTRSPLARQDFDLFKSFGSRLLLGSSIPTLDNRLAKIYEPTAPAPTQRLAMLLEARAKGLNVYVAMAPTYPECNEQDLLTTLSQIKTADPVTIFHEPINIRAENVERIRKHGESIGVEMKTDVFETNGAWLEYALRAFEMVEHSARALGIADHLHLWPDKSFRTWARGINHREKWVHRWHSRISEWPAKP